MSIFPNTVFAYDEQFYSSNDILYYNPESGQCVKPGANYTTNMDLPSLVGNNNAEKIWRFLIDQGLSPEQAAGVMGNIEQESGFNPDAEEGPESAARHSARPVGYGIVQWTAERRIALEDAASEQGVAASDLSFQLAFMVTESKGRTVRESVAELGYGEAGANEWETLKQQQTVEDATVFWHNNFEESADTPEQVIPVRGAYAQNAYDSFKSLATPFAAPAASSGEACNNTFSGGDLAQTLLAYAHPEYHEPGFIQMMPAYAEAVKTAQAEGRGVGGIQYPGIDCAGFVSLLLVDSGFDPEYNSKGMYATPGATGEAIQRSWMEENWTSLGKGGDINPADLRPGDVAVTRPGSGEHIFLYVGQIDGFGNIFASASLDERAPMAAGSYENAVDDSYDWFGKR